jgi:hypothetical protein
VTSDFSSEADENCVLLGHYAASSGNFLTDVSGKHTDPIFNGHLEDETGTLSRNACKKLLLLVA